MRAQDTSEPTVSIGLPIYNGERYLRQALESILAQSFGDFELIMSDNASTDATGAIAREYAARDSRIRYVRNERNIGVSRNFNATFRLATGRYFKWAACDDLIDPTLVEKCVRILDGDRLVVAAFSKTRLIGPDGGFLRNQDQCLHAVQARQSDRLAYVFANLSLCDAQYGLIRADVLRRTSLLGDFVGSDICFLAELALYGKLFEIPEHLFSRRFHPGALTSSAGQKRAADYGAGPLAGFALRRWRLVLESAKAVRRAPLRATERARAMWLIARKIGWDRSHLTQELAEVLRGMFRRAD
jgi:glycosyltransferase involved in cell wall biosynthesis